MEQNKTPTRRFWDAREKMEEEARILQYCLDGHSRSKMGWYLHLMLCHGVIRGSDLDEFGKAFSRNLLTLSRGSAEWSPDWGDEDGYGRVGDGYWYIDYHD